MTLEDIIDKYNGEIVDLEEVKDDIIKAGFEISLKEKIVNGEKQGWIYILKDGEIATELTYGYVNKEVLVQK